MLLSKKYIDQLFDGSFTASGNCIKGKYRGYYIVCNAIRDNAGAYKMTVCAHSDDDPGNAKLGSYLREAVSGIRNILGAGIEQYSFWLNIRVGSGKAFTELCNDTVARIIRWLESNYYTSGCQLSGSNDRVECYSINGTNMWLCPASLAAVQQHFETNKEQARSQKSDLIRGFVGALLGALAGGVLYVILYKLGFVAGISGLVMAVLALMLYEKFGGCLDIKGVICCAVVIIAMVYFANKLAWSWEIYGELKDYGWGFSDVFKQMSYIIDKAGLKSDYTESLVMGYIFTALGAVGRFIGAVRSSTGKYKIKKN